VQLSSSGATQRSRVFVDHLKPIEGFFGFLSGKYPNSIIGFVLIANFTLVGNQGFSTSGEQSDPAREVHG
jgi:hypothetical protein